jgi:hypothetical protein
MLTFISRKISLLSFVVTKTKIDPNMNAAVTKNATTNINTFSLKRLYRFLCLYLSFLNFYDLTILEYTSSPHHIFTAARGEE